jgi:ATP-dependent exoDNAse (exonuclease V) alpha subunit
MGRAGAGKTFAFDAVRSSFEASGFRVIGTSLSARAARELEASAGIRSQTALSLRNSVVAGWERLDPRTVLVIDEAAMLGTRLLADLVNEADRAGAKVIAVGDPKQTARDRGRRALLRAGQAPGRERTDVEPATT